MKNKHKYTSCIIQFNNNNVYTNAYLPGIKYQQKNIYIHLVVGITYIILHVYGCNKEGTQYLR